MAVASTETFAANSKEFDRQPKADYSQNRKGSHTERTTAMAFTLLLCATSIALTILGLAVAAIPLAAFALYRSLDAI